MSVLSFFGNRWPYTPTRPAPGVTRIAVVGDSMAFGQGVSHAQSLSQRLAFHLNGSRPDSWFEGVTFGIPGGCFVHALERAVDQALPAAPHVVILAVCANDALMLRPEPPSAEEVGQSWRDYAPILSRRFRRFLDTVHATTPDTEVVLLYLDRHVSLGSVHPAAVLAAMAAECEVPFVDGSAALAGLSLEQMTVSPADRRHLSGQAHDLVARQVARVLRPRLPDGSTAGTTPSWVDGALSMADALGASGVPPALAAAQAHAALRAKWHDRRNRQRDTHTAAHARVTAALERRQRAAWPRLLQDALAHHVVAQPVADHLDALEPRLYELNTLLGALEHAVDTGALGQPLTGLPLPVAGADDAASVTAAAATARRLVESLGPMAEPMLPGDAMRTRYLALVARARALAQRFLACTTRLAAARAAVASGAWAPDVAALARALDHGAVAFADALGALAPAVDAARPETILADGLMPDTTMRFEIPILAAPGPELWSYRVGIDADVPAFREAHIACGNVVRDGVARVYSLDLPLALVSRIDVTVFGVAADCRSGLSVRPARLVMPSGHAVTIPTPPEVVQHGATTLQLRYHDVSPFERCA